MQEVDIVLRWVDPTDDDWIKEKRKYSGSQDNKKNSVSDSTDVRYRDWDLLRFWFRCVENNAPWVRKIFFVTYGHIPKWLNTKNEKLRIVKHNEFIPQEWLPTFSSRTIDFNIHRIKDLSERYVFFDDDMYVINKTNIEDFFLYGKPRDSKVYNLITARQEEYVSRNIYNDMEIINKYFDKQNDKGVFSLKYGKYLYKNIVLYPWKYYTGFQDFHIPSSFLKSTLEDLWSREGDLLSETCKNKFRTSNDLNQWLIRYWQLSDNNFIPRSCDFGKYVDVSDNISSIIKIVKSKKYKVICINDCQVDDFDTRKLSIHKAFQERFSEFSNYEIESLK